MVKTRKVLEKCPPYHPLQHTHTYTQTKRHYIKILLCWRVDVENNFKVVIHYPVKLFGLFPNIRVYLVNYTHYKRMSDSVIAQNVARWSGDRTRVRNPTTRKLAVACGVYGDVFLCCPFSHEVSWMRS